MASSAPLKILILEDEFLVAESLAALIKKLGHHVCSVATSVDEAIVGAREHKPHLALLDISVKGTANGIDAGRIIRGELNIPTIFLTDLKSDEVFDLAKQTKPHAFLNKPVTLVELKRALELATISMQDDGSEESAVYVVDDAVYLKGRDGNVKVLLDDIYYLRAGGAYCDVVMKSGKETLAKSMGTVLSSLQQLKGGQRFVQIHRSTAVNATHVARVVGNMIEVNGETFDISETYRDTVKKMFATI